MFEEELWELNGKYYLEIDETTDELAEMLVSLVGKMKEFTCLYDKRDEIMTKRDALMEKIKYFRGLKGMKREGGDVSDTEKE